MVAAGNTAAFSSIPGVTPEILSAAIIASLDAFSVAIRYIWIAAGCLTFAALIGRHLSLSIDVT